ERAAWGNQWVLFNRRAVEIARAGARAGTGGRGDQVLVAGSIAPLEDCYRPDLVPPTSDRLREHLRPAHLLARLGADLLWIETMNTMREARAAVLAARAVGRDALLSLCPGAPDALLSGEKIADAVPRLVDVGGGVLAGILLNCAGPDLLEAA